MKIVLASGNPHKHTEFSHFFRTLDSLKGTGVELLFADDFKGSLETSGKLEKLGEIEETGATFEENALIKARAWADFAGMPAIADDSGLEVRALSWVPGIYSARAAAGSDRDRANWLLEKLGDAQDRRACFTASLVIAYPGGAQDERNYFCAEGRCWGNIAPAYRGENGFGYDPVFIPDGYDRTFGELAPEVKAQISHRAIAMRGMAQMMPAVLKYQVV